MQVTACVSLHDEASATSLPAAFWKLRQRLIRPIEVTLGFVLAERGSSRERTRWHASRLIRRGRGTLVYPGKFVGKILFQLQHRSKKIAHPLQSLQGSFRVKIQPTD